MSNTDKVLLFAQMKLKRIKAKDLATAFNISAVYVSDILNGRRNGPKAEEWAQKFDEYVSQKEKGKTSERTTRV